MNSTQPDHAPNRELAHQRSYLLRLWRAESEQPAWWRASLENTHTGERFGFATLEQLFVFLIEQVERAPQAIARPAEQSTTHQE